MKSFTGKSENNDFKEALEDAISKAKDGLPSDYVDWKFVSMHGDDGGIAQVHNLYVTISAKAFGS